MFLVAPESTFWLAPPPPKLWNFLLSACLLWKHWGISLTLVPAGVYFFSPGMLTTLADYIFEAQTSISHLHWQTFAMRLRQGSICPKGVTVCGLAVDFSSEHGPVCPPAVTIPLRHGSVCWPWLLSPAAVLDYACKTMICLPPSRCLHW